MNLPIFLAGVSGRPTRAPTFSKSNFKKAVEAKGLQDQGPAQKTFFSISNLGGQRSPSRGFRRDPSPAGRISLAAKPRKRRTRRRALWQLYDGHRPPGAGAPRASSFILCPHSTRPPCLRPPAERPERLLCPEKPAPRLYLFVH